MRIATEAPARTVTITREPEHPGYDTLGDADTWGEDFYLLVDGERIGGTYWCTAADIKDGERWASYGPAGLSMGHRTREDAEQVQVDVHLANEAARAADCAAAEDFANRLRDLLTLTPDTPRFFRGHDQHLRADQVIRLAHERVQGQAVLEGDEVIAAGFTAACAWRRFVYREQATDTVLQYVQNLSPWEFCQFLGELVVADVRTGRAQDRYFCELATRIDAAARAAAAPVTTTSVEPQTEPETAIAPDAYDKALAKAAEIGYRNADDAGLMAALCDGVLQITVGAVSPRLVWEGAQRRGMTTKELMRLASENPPAVAELMW